MKSQKWLPTKDPVKLEGPAAERRCFIIGNGPSQNNIDLTKLKKETTYGMNDLRKIFKWFRPTKWFLTDGKYNRTYRWEIADALDKYPDLHIVTSSYSHPNDPRHERVERIKVDGSTAELSKGNIHFHTAKGTAYYSVATVSYIAMQYAFRQGFRQIYTVGFDSREPRPDLADHFIEGYCDKLEEPKERGKKDPLRDDLWELAFGVAQKQFEKHHGGIWDVSKSKAGFFKKRNLEDVLAGKHGDRR